MATDLQLTSPAFDDGGTVPERYTCDGDDVSPPLRIEGVPDDAAALALVVDDPDAPGGTFTHWLLWNVPADATGLPEGVEASASVGALDGARQGRNDFGEVGYRGPCPPGGDGPHTYRFTLSALSGALDVDAGAERDAVSSAVESREVARTRLTASFER